jgi:UDP-N-acetylmuramate: L-alanyl-gamma-D-glutamyl-meso-diaminopimelate ligase
MASLAGMLKQRGFRVTGSDAAAYPPMSDFLSELGVPVAQPFNPRNLEPRPDLVVVGNAISRGNVELEQVLDQRIPFCSLPQLLHEEFLRGQGSAGGGGYARKDHNYFHARLDFSYRGNAAVISNRRHRGEFCFQLSFGQGKHFILEGDEYDTAFFDKGAEVPALLSRRRGL